MFRLPAVIAVFCAAAACGGSSTPSSPTASAPFSATDLTVGSGATAAAGNRATVSYAGWLYSASAAGNKGSQFDSGAFSFTLGTGSVIAGFDRGVAGMKVGGSRRLIVPPDLGYGGNPPGGSGIPANATLVFDVTLTALQ